jgi:hypothetical protein
MSHCRIEGMRAVIIGVAVLCVLSPALLLVEVGS